MNYVYSVLWFVVAVILFVRYRKENKAVYLLSGYFLFMGAWWLVNALSPDIDLMGGYYVWIYRGVTLVVLVVVLLYYMRIKNASKTKNDPDEKTTKKEK